MNIEAEKKEIEKLPDRLFVVVADDDEWYGNRNSKALKKLKSTWNVNIVNGAEELFRLSMVGDKDLQQADLVVLDNDFSIRRKEDRKWLFENTGQARQVVDRLLRNGVDEYAARDAVFPGGLNYAISLRTLGYRQKIVIVSNAPPNHEFLKSREEEYKIPLIVNGSSTKGSSFGHYFCDYRYLQGGQVNLNDVILDGEMEDSFSWLLTRVLSER